MLKLSADEFAACVKEALTDLPPHLSKYLEGIVVDVEPTPDRRTLQELDIDDPSELLGMYHGTPLTERHWDDAPQLPDRITVYQRNIERMCESREEIIAEIRTTVLHEVGHHFGLDEDDLDALGFA